MSTPPPPPHMSTPGDTLFWFVFRPSLYHRGDVEYHTPYGGAPEQLPRHRIPFTHNARRYGHQHGGHCCAPSKWTKRISGLLPRLGDGHVGFFSASARFTIPVLAGITGTASVPGTPTVPEGPTTGAGTLSNFVANHGTCRVPLYWNLENKPVCNATVNYCAGRRLEAKASYGI